MAQDLERLQQEVFRDPDSVETRLVLGDHLLEVGDLRGELIALQAKRLKTGRPPSPREAQLVQRHRARWLGPLNHCVAEPTFSLGFLSECTLVALSERALESPLWATVRSITVGTVGDRLPKEKLERLLSTASLGALREICQAPAGLIKPLSSPSSPMGENLPNLRGLHLRQGSQRSIQAALAGLKPPLGDQLHAYSTIFQGWRLSLSRAQEERSLREAAKLRATLPERRGKWEERLSRGLKPLAPSLRQVEVRLPAIARRGDYQKVATIVEGLGLTVKDLMPLVAVDAEAPRRLRHPRFGIGTLLEERPDGRFVVVQFEDRQRTLLASTLTPSPDPHSAASD